ncbi:hypothetical protein L7F22_040070 [Adiantum nelumboides]|nr:hypothetical protein [Adiantum nelumboides]
MATRRRGGAGCAPSLHRWLALAVLVLALLCGVAQAAKDYYKIMGVDTGADDRTIKRAYRKLAQKLHPDKHPDKAEEFVELSEAYQVLSDKEARKIYNRFGEEGVKRHLAQKQASQGGADNPNDPMNVFRQFFGGGFQQQQQTRKGSTKQFNLEVNLADMYKGRTVTISFDRHVLCPACDGSGAKSKSDIHHCETCNGQGVRIVRQQIMPGFVTNAQVTCDACGGQGRVIKHKCPKCEGAKVIVEQVELDVEILPGTHEGEELLYEAEADEGPDFDAGDVLVKVQSKPQRGDFRRRDKHLYATIPISLADALLGFEMNLTHLDGSIVTLKRAAVTQPNYVATLAGQGMPLHHSVQPHDGTTHGNLYVEYNVVLPDQVEGDLLKVASPGDRDVDCAKNHKDSERFPEK